MNKNQMFGGKTQTGDTQNYKLKKSPHIDAATQNIQFLKL
jgi:hypothetical protein